MFTKAIQGRLKRKEESFKVALSFKIDDKVDYN